MSASGDGASLLDLPNEVLIYDILPLLSPKDLASVSQVNKQLHVLVEDPGVWRLKTARDFSYRPSIALSKPSEDDSHWFQRVYLGLWRPRVYLWGANENSRLAAVPGVDVNRFSSVPAPADATPSFKAPPPKYPADSLAADGEESEKVEGECRERIVDLQTGGWSYTARDAKGGVWVWGTLWAERGGWYEDWESPHTRVDKATRIPLPCRAVSVACGRSHLLVLDSDNLIWELRNWGRAYRHTAPELTAPSASGARGPGRSAHIAQIAAGWHISACLTNEGGVFIWFPFSDEFKSALTATDGLHGPLSDGDESRKLRWGEVAPEPILDAPPVPERPEDAPNPGFDDERQRVVRIACGIDFLLALKENGEVWFLPCMNNRLGDWVYLPQFSSPGISHITAQFQTLASYSVPSSSGAAPDESNVLVGKAVGPYTLQSLQEVEAKPLPVLDGPVVQFAAGDHHFAALTNRGDMYTWGEDGHGQLGLSSDGALQKTFYRGQRREAPTRVNFPADDDGQKAFVFSICAAGMQSGALVLGHKRHDPEPVKREEEEGDDEASSQMRRLGMRAPPFGRFGRIGGLWRGGRW